MDPAAVPPERYREALRRLDEIEQTEGVRILFACESGSRAWGFASADSDFDVRFLYVRPVADYLSVERVRDVIERPIEDDMDVSGWDLPKALALLRKGNPPLAEWLGSPLVYRADAAFLAGMQALLEAAYRPDVARHHYLSMARGNHAHYLTGERVQPKRYLYVLRPLLAVRWIDDGRWPVPTPFAPLVAAGLRDAAAQAELDALLVRKQTGLEKDIEPRLPALDRWIHERFDEASRGSREALPLTPAAPLDAFLHATLRRVWGASF